ncbi:MAG: hypothetical protein ABL974_09470 [Prosthecobacter sp.]
MMRILKWLFAPQPLPVVLRKVILWWEVRRIAFNLFVGVYGTLCLFVSGWAMSESGQLESPEDGIEPLAIWLGGFVANVCYTGGWLVEVPVRLFTPETPPNFGPRLLKFGLGFSFIVISAPAVLWVGYRSLQIIGIAK